MEKAYPKATMHGEVLGDWGSLAYACLLTHTPLQGLHSTRLPHSVISHLA